MNLLRSRNCIRCFLERWNAPTLDASITKHTLVLRPLNKDQFARALPSPEQSYSSNVREVEAR